MMMLNISRSHSVAQPLSAAARTPFSASVGERFRFRVDDCSRLYRDLRTCIPSEQSLGLCHSSRPQPSAAAAVGGHARLPPIRVREECLVAWEAKALVTFSVVETPRQYGFDSRAIRGDPRLMCATSSASAVVASGLMRGLIGERQRCAPDEHGAAWPVSRRSALLPSRC
jgi:hypothetical protein